MSRTSYLRILLVIAVAVAIAMVVGGEPWGPA
jgi:hypothetical protein